MKSAFIAIIIGSLLASEISAKCVCDPNDRSCVDRCVTDTNACISECQSNNDCYSKCIEYYWPGMDSEGTTRSESTPTSTRWGASSTYRNSMTSANPGYTTTSTWGASSTWGTSTSSVLWSQASNWSSMSTWTTGHSGTHTPSATSSTSGSSNLKVSTLAIGIMGVAASYFLY